MLDIRHGGEILAVGGPTAPSSSPTPPSGSPTPPSNDQTTPSSEQAAQLNLQQVAQRIVNTLGDVVLTSAKPVGTPFDYLFPKLKTDAKAHLPGAPSKVVDDLNALGAAMTDPSTLLESNSTIPAVYVYWGQFIDHDITANTDLVSNTKTTDITKIAVNGPASPDEVTNNLRNLRKPTLDLDSVYGDGPAFLNASKNDHGFYDGAHFRVGKNHVAGIPKPGELGERIPPVADLKRDLPRIGPLLTAGVITKQDLPESLRNDPQLATRALIGDSRNDENLIVAQFHLAFLRFHNTIVDGLTGPKGTGLFDQLRALLGELLGGLTGNDDKTRFRIAQRLTRWHYQWLVVNDFLRTITLGGVVDKILTEGPRFYKPLANGELFMPLEFSTAAYRFGHSMVRSGYDHNRNFGVQTNGVVGRASLEQLFEFTGGGFELVKNDPTRSTPNPLGGSPTLPFNWIIEWDRLTDKNDPFTPHFGKKIDTKLSAISTTQPATLTAVLNMVNEGNAPSIQDGSPPNPTRLLLRHLARRNLLRGYMLSIPTGQSVAAQLGIKPLTQAELLKDNTPAVTSALQQGGFLQNTPLWYYVLKEAEVRANGNTLGRLGSHIVAETIIGVLRYDKDSYLNAPGGWDPSKGVKLSDGRSIVSIRDFLAFSGLPS